MLIRHVYPILTLLTSSGTDSDTGAQGSARPCSPLDVSHPCWAAGNTLIGNETVQRAVQVQAGRCDFTIPTGSQEFENCKAVQHAVKQTFAWMATVTGGVVSYGACCSCIANTDYSRVKGSSDFLSGLDCRD